MISRYVLVDPDGSEHDFEYQRADNAVQDAQKQGCAVVERQYELSDTELVWTPNGEDTWP